ncbi:hypothetical protein GW17_00027164, partial [Ensete ventricosum]
MDTYGQICHAECANSDYWYTDRPLPGVPPKIDRRRPIKGEIDHWRSIEGEKGKKKKKRKRRKKKRRRRTYFPRVVLARVSSLPLPAGVFSPVQGDGMSPHAGRKIEATTTCSNGPSPKCWSPKFPCIPAWCSRPWATNILWSITSYCYSTQGLPYQAVRPRTWRYVSLRGSPTVVEIDRRLLIEGERRRGRNMFPRVALPRFPRALIFPIPPVRSVAHGRFFSPPEEKNEATVRYHPKLIPGLQPDMPNFLKAMIQQGRKVDEPLTLQQILDHLAWFLQSWLPFEGREGASPGHAEPSRRGGDRGGLETGNVNTPLGVISPSMEKSLFYPAKPAADSVSTSRKERKGKKNPY